MTSRQGVLTCRVAWLIRNKAAGAREPRTSVDNTTTLATVFGGPGFVSFHTISLGIVSRQQHTHTSVTQLRTGTQYTQVTFQDTLTMSSLTIFPPADNVIWKRFKVYVKKPDGIYLNLGKYVRLGGACEQEEGG